MYINNVKDHLHAWSGNGGVILDFSRPKLTESSQVVNFNLGMNSHTIISTEDIKKIFF
jgi:hypothetical protein